MSTVPHPQHQRVIDPKFVLPALVILVTQVGLYIVMASRGFEFTDESYYLHNYLHWREFTGTVTFFGAYFEWPFRMLGESIAGMRLLSLVLVLASAAVLMLQLLRFAFLDHTGSAGRGRLACQVVAPVASAMLFFSFLTTLRAPSYNLLSIVTIALMTACVLRVLTPGPTPRPVLLCFAYGLALGVCFLSKATTSVLVTLAHLVFFCVLYRDWKAPWLLRGLVAIVAGFALNFLVLQLIFPQWLASLREGIELMRVRDGAYGPMYMFNGLRWEFQKQISVIGPWLAAAAVVLFILRGSIRRGSRTAVAAVALAATAAISFTIVAEHQGSNWLIVVTASAFALWLTERWADDGQTVRVGATRDIALLLLLLFLPVAFSYGTNMSVLGHSVIAGLFAFCAVYLWLYRLAYARLLTSSALALCLVLMCLPTLMLQWGAWTDVAYTYRIATPLKQQVMPVQPHAGSGVVHVDPVTRKAVEGLHAMAREAGMQPDQDVLDMTGDGPGLIYLLGANPLGSPWLLGGYAGSPASVERVMAKLDHEKIRHAWVLVSTDNPRRMKDWQGMLTRRIGSDTHQPAGAVTIFNPHGRDRDEPREVDVQLWKPRAANQPAVDVAYQPH